MGFFLDLNYVYLICIIIFYDEYNNYLCVFFDILVEGVCKIFVRYENVLCYFVEDKNVFIYNY